MKKSLVVLLGITVAGVTFGVWADTAAPQTLNVKAHLTAGTCTIANKDAAIAFNDITKDVWNKALTQTALDQKHLIMNVDCTANNAYTNVHMTPTFDTNAGYKTLINLKGPAKDDVAVRLFKTTATDQWDNTGAFQSGERIDYKLANHLVSIDMYPSVLKNDSPSVTYTSGDYNGTVSFNFDFD